MIKVGLMTNFELYYSINVAADCLLCEGLDDKGVRIASCCITRIALPPDLVIVNGIASIVRSVYVQSW